MEYSNAKFRQARDDILEHFDKEMNGKVLFKVDCDTDELWHLYLDSFPEEIRGIYRERAWHDCTACRRWFKAAGNIVSVNSNGTLVSLFGCETIPEYQEVYNILNDYLINKPIKNIFVSSLKQIGIEKSLEETETDVDSLVVPPSFMRHDHFYLPVPKKYQTDKNHIGKKQDKFLTNRLLLEASLKEINEYAVNSILDLINDNNLYRGTQWKSTLEKFKSIKEKIPEDADENRLNNWYWYQSVMLGDMVSRLKNSSIGILLVNVSKGVPLERALTLYETITAPSNYQRPKPIFTQQMLEDGKKKIEELGYIESIPRRYANIEDLSVNNVLFVDRDVASSMKDSNDVFDMLSQQAITKPKKFDYIEAISLDDFVEDVLPKAKQLSLYTDTILKNNFVSLLTAQNDEAPSMFKWDNPFSWTYINNVADSMKQQVKNMGGDVDVDVRFSIRWNDFMEEWDENDLDAHCTTPQGQEIYYMSMKDPHTGGWLDVDIVHPRRNEVAIENIQFKDKTKMIPGEYLFRVHQFNYRGGNRGFDAEIEINNTIYPFSYPHRLTQEEYVNVAKVIIDTNYDLAIVPILSTEVQSSTFWNVKMNDFVPVSLVCYSPNYWGNAIGNKHLFFMLKECKNDSTPNAWYNEFLNTELLEHKRVMEALGTAAKVDEADNQLSGMGFAVTKENEITLKAIIDDTEKIYKVII